MEFRVSSRNRSGGAMDHSRILVVGATGYLGAMVTKASVAAGHPTAALIRPQAISNRDNAPLLDSFRELGVTLFEGSLDDREILLKALKGVDIVISTVGGAAIYEQSKLIEAIKEAGTIKRFLPSEYGINVDRATLLEPLQGSLGLKRDIRRLTEQSGIPYTFVANVTFASFFLTPLWQVTESLAKKTPPRDKVVFYGDGEAKVPFVCPEDIATYVIKAIDDPRTINKTLSIRPQLSFLSPKRVVALWEGKIGHVLEKIHMSEQEMLQAIAAPGSPLIVPNMTLSMLLAIRYSIFLKGEMDQVLAPNEVEASDLYPEVQYTSVEKFLDQFV